jgi:hypothetical protein
MALRGIIPAASSRRGPSGFAQQEVHGPAAADVRAGTTQMVEDCRVRAACVFEGVREHGEAVGV